jgi:hypothetical protein
MIGRIYTFAIVLFWLAAMSWLVVQKILPTLVAGDVPAYEVAKQEESNSQPPISAWKIVWQDRDIGHSISSPIKISDEETQLRSLLIFENLPLNALMESLLGNLGRVMGPALGTPDSIGEMKVATRLNVSKPRGFGDFETVLNLQGMTGFMVVEGKRISGNKLEVSAFSPHLLGEDGQPTSLTKTTLDLPKEALVADFISPRDKLADLHVGRWWNFPVYRVFPPSSTGELVKAVVERHAVIFWDGDPVETMEVVYYSDAGSGIRREPIGKAWVAHDGTILKQEFRLGAQVFTFERLSDEAAERRRAMLEDEQFREFFDSR